jgi:hypothetical protein
MSKKKCFSMSLYKIFEAERGEKILDFVDAIISVQDSSLAENTEEICGILTKCDECGPHTIYKVNLGDKLNFIHFLNRG